MDLLEYVGHEVVLEVFDTKCGEEGSWISIDEINVPYMVTESGEGYVPTAECPMRILELAEELGLDYDDTVLDLSFEDGATNSSSNFHNLIHPRETARGK